VNVSRSKWLRNTPWRTGLLAGVCLWLFISTPLSEWAVYDRISIQSGEAWRLITGHLVHFSFAHVAWNVFFLLIAGTVLETRNARQFIFLTISTALSISVSLYIFTPQYVQYGGLSGIASSYLVYFALLKIMQQKWQAWPWIGLLVLFVAKILFELLQGMPVFIPDAIFQVVPLAHLAGALVGLLFAAFEPGRVAHTASA
jgi:rhomboid family GlyGly-CTERM serine protease